MVICGIKLTHDGAIALIDNGKLIFSYELEKLNNNNRYTSLNEFNPGFFNSILGTFGYSLNSIDRIVIDGWGELLNPTSSEYDYPKSQFNINTLSGDIIQLELAKYGMCIKDEDLLKVSSFSYPKLGLNYNSYMHVSGHVMSAYCTSPFAKNDNDAFVLVWDGAMCPQLFYIHAKNKSVENVGSIFNLLGGLYGAFASNFKPFNHLAFNDLSIAGKVMAYIAKGKCHDNVLFECKRLFQIQEKKIDLSLRIDPLTISQLTTKLLSDIITYGELNSIDSIDMMATFHVFVQDIVVDKLKICIQNYSNYNKNLCFVGGCALNIKWNSAIRNSGIFKEMWVPPFPNDSGSAVGAACCEMVSATKNLALDWDVYSGPPIITGDIKHFSWSEFDCSIKDLAHLLYITDEPVVFLNGRAELGPRALGNRSMLASPINFSMKEVLNKVKKRESYRPVAPICLEEDAPNIFTPGSPDPLMLFDHMVKENWKIKIPAICHLDGSARLQTITKESNAMVYELLSEFKKITGIPLLCNTSANFNGKGFFPDISSAMLWGEIPMIWSGGKLYTNPKSEIFNQVNNYFNI